MMNFFKNLVRLFKSVCDKILSSPKFYALPLMAFILLLRKILMNSTKAEQIIRTNLSDFLGKLDKGAISKVLVKKDSLFFMDKNNSLYKTTHSLFPKG